MEEDIFLRVRELLYEDKISDARELLEAVKFLLWKRIKNT